MTNGEIYNYKYLRERYSNNEWVTNSDCEAIHNAYENGDFENEIKLISGMFAFLFMIQARFSYAYKRQGRRNLFFIQ